MITSIRIVLLPCIGFFWARGDGALAFGLYLCAVFTDWADGWLARRLGTASAWGAYFDTLTDVCFLASLLILLGVHGAVPQWLVIAPLGCALVFFATSRGKTLRYDPIGKHYGSALYAIVGCLLVHHSGLLCLALTSVVVVLSLVVTANRLRLSITS